MSGLYATGVDRDQREEGGKPPLPLKALSVQIFAADDGARSMANEWVVTHRHRAHHIIDQRLVEQGCGCLNFEMRRIKIREAHHVSELFEVPLKT